MLINVRFFKSLLAACLIAFTASTGFSADPPNVVDGRWEWENDIGGNVINSSLVLHSKADKLTGKYSNQNFSADIQNGEIEKDGENSNIWFHVDFKNEQGEEYTVKFSGEHADGQIEGDVEILQNGEPQIEFAWNPKRVTEAKDVIGSWDFEFTGPDGVEYRPTLNVTADGDNLKGTLGMQSAESVTCKSTKLAGHELTVSVSIPYEGTSVGLVFSLHPRGDKMLGSATYSVNGDNGDFLVAGKRRILDPRLQALVGAWSCKVVGPDGVERSPMLVARVEGDKLVGTLTEASMEAVEIKAFELKDDMACFDFTNGHDDVTVELTWKCKADGDRLVGTLDFSIDGNSGTIDIEGTKLKAD